jgi:hypothetical protein
MGVNEGFDYFLQFTTCLGTNILSNYKNRESNLEDIYPQHIRHMSLNG